MSSILSLIVSFFVNSIWQIALVGGVGWLIVRFVKRLGPTTEHFVWTSTLTIAALVPVFPLLRRLLSMSFDLRAAEANSSINLIAVSNSGLIGKDALALPEFLLVALTFVYLILLSYFALRFLWSCICAIELLRGARKAILTPEQAEILRSCLSSYSLEKAQIFTSHQVSGPVTLGLRRPVLLVPEDFVTRCNAQDFLAALAHECAHIKRCDFGKNLLYEAAGLLIAFHPLVWLIKSKIAQSREMICDEMATESLIDSRNYTQSLLRLATMTATNFRFSTTHAIGIFDADILEKRIMMMNVRKQSVGGGTRFGLILLAAFVLLLTGAGGVAMAVGIEPADSSQAVKQGKTYGHVYRVGKDVSAPIPTHLVDAQFPKAVLASKDKFQGVCLIGLVVDASGEPRDVHVVHSLRPDFDANAIKAVQQYHFKPAKRSGTPVAVAVNIEVTFRVYSNARR